MLKEMLDKAANRIVWAFYIIIAVAFGLGALSVWGIPKLWAFIKPIIHNLTA